MKARRKRAARQRTVAIAVVVVFVIIIAWGIISLFNSPTPAKDFTLPTVDANGQLGQNLTLNQFRGSIIVLEFMEPWCPNCQNQAPTMETLKLTYSAQGVIFLAVGGHYAGSPPEGTGSPPTPADMAQFIQTYHATMYFMFDSSGNVFLRYGVQEWPRIFIIDRNFNIRADFTGVQSLSTLSSSINGVLS